MIVYCDRKRSRRLLVHASVLTAILLSVTPAHAVPGIDSRPSNLSCSAPPRPDTGAYTLADAFPNINLRGTLTIEFPKNDSTYLFAMRQKGRIYRFLNDSSTSQKSTPLSLRSLFDQEDGVAGQNGLLDMAFHPDFSSNGELYIAYNVPDDSSYVARYTSSDGGASFSQNGEVLLSLSQPGIHHGIGSLFFGQDGYLYISFGESLSSNKAQDPFTWYGKILRIDVDSGTPYGIPADNPYVNGGGAPEVYALGFRNPWRVSQDSGGSGEIWAADVGNHDWEEVDNVAKGGNYGWPIREGAHCVNANSCDTTGLTDPVYEYSHDTGCAVIGGHVYRGSLLPSLIGKYIFTDTCNGKVYSLEVTGQGPVVETLVDTGFQIRDFSESPDGELYLIAGEEEELKQLVADSSSGGSPVNDYPLTLSATGCFDLSDPTQVEEGVIPYDVNTKLWSDGASKRRWMAIPDGTQIDVLSDGDWDFPEGTVLIKEFSWNGSPFETRLFVLHNDGGWAGYTYEWNASLTDADLVSTEGLSKQIDGQLNWMYPTRSQCLECHSTAAGRSLGLETAQLNGQFLYPSGITSNQLETLDHIGMFSNGLGGAPENLPALTDVNNQSATPDDRSRSYLHANCANCHRPNGPGQGPMDFRFQTAFDETGTCNVAPTSGDLGVPGAKIMSPGDPASSVMSLRMHTLGNQRMPPLASQIVDPDGTAAIDAWINSREACANNAPVAVDDSPAAIDEGGSISGTFNVLDNDTDADGDSLTAAVVASPSNSSSFSLNSDGTFSYTHDGSETTTDSFTYRADDGTDDSNVATVTITITATNNAPVAVDDSPAAIEEGGSISGTFNVLDNDTDADGDSLTAAVVANPSNAYSFSMNLDGTFSYTHDGSETTTDSFTYRADDGTDDSNVATVTITITANDAPVAVDDSPAAIDEGGSISGTFNVLDNDTDAEDDSLTAAVVASPSNSSSFTLNADGTFSYTHDSSETTTDSFTYMANDGTDNSNVATVTITITAPTPPPTNNAPVAVDDSPTAIDEGGSISGTFNVLDNDTDADGDSLTAAVVASPSNASSFSLNSDGTFSYTHDGSETTTDSFTYQANDGTDDSNVATVTITITAPTPPTPPPPSSSGGGSFGVPSLLFLLGFAACRRKLRDC